MILFGRKACEIKQQLRPASTVIPYNGVPLLCLDFWDFRSINQWLTIIALISILMKALFKSIG
ncbi:hypothetical protein A6U89_11275 [Agrobacterium sp. B133/95]|nr:hypothetical protein A6U88_29815 [Agrobacterium sp. B131/95]OCJ23172.1 hypothetical protein A6U89_11275 [Agrobacterium sp. B133/95]